MKSKHCARLTENSYVYLSHCTSLNFKDIGQSCFPQIYPKISNLVDMHTEAGTHNLVARGSPFEVVSATVPSFYLGCKCIWGGAGRNSNGAEAFPSLTFAPTLVYLK